MGITKFEFGMAAYINHVSRTYELSYLKNIIFLYKKRWTTEMSLDRNKTEHFDQYLDDPLPFVISYSTNFQGFKLDLKTPIIFT